MRYLVISFSWEERESYFDHVLAGNAEEARKWVQRVRGEYADVTDVFTAEELISNAECLKDSSEAEIRDNMNKLESSQ